MQRVSVVRYPVIGAGTVCLTGIGRSSAAAAGALSARCNPPAARQPAQRRPRRSLPRPRTCGSQPLESPAMAHPRRLRRHPRRQAGRPTRLLQRARAAWLAAPRPPSAAGEGWGAAGSAGEALGGLGWVGMLPGCLLLTTELPTDRPSRVQLYGMLGL